MNFLVSKINTGYLRNAFLRCSDSNEAEFRASRNRRARNLWVWNNSGNEERGRINRATQAFGRFDFRVTESYLDHVRGRYRGAGMPDMSLLHFSRMGTRAFDLSAGIETPATLETPVALDNVRPDGPFLREVMRGRSLLSSGVRMLLAERGLRTTLIESFGYNSRYAALFSSETREAQVARTHGRRSEPGVLVASTYPALYILHEYGHALDASSSLLFVDDFSQMPAFRQAYLKGLTRVAGDRRRWLTDRLDHFLPQECGGINTPQGARKEGFAELFACVAGGSERVFPMSALFREAVDVVRQSIDAVEFEMSLPIDPKEIIVPAP